MATDVTISNPRDSAFIISVEVQVQDFTTREWKKLFSHDILPGIDAVLEMHGNRRFIIEEDVPIL